MLSNGFLFRMDYLRFLIWKCIMSSVWLKVSEINISHLIPVCTYLPNQSRQHKINVVACSGLLWLTLCPVLHYKSKTWTKNILRQFKHKNTILVSSSIYQNVYSHLCIRYNNVHKYKGCFPCYCDLCSFSVLVVL